MEAEVNGSTLPAVDYLPHQQEDRVTDDQEADAEHELDDITSSRPKKKRRVVQDSDKKFECPHVGCTKAYSRAEHLYRHQLNRKSPLYRKDFALTELTKL